MQNDAFFEPSNETLQFSQNISGESSDPFHFVLTPKTLTCYKAAPGGENEKLFMIPLDGLKLRNSKENLETHVVALFNPNGQNVHPDYKELELLCNSADECISWMKSFSKALTNQKNVCFIVICT